jgi:hypothetical protein
MNSAGAAEKPLPGTLQEGSSGVGAHRRPEARRRRGTSHPASWGVRQRAGGVGGAPLWACASEPGVWGGAPLKSVHGLGTHHPDGARTGRRPRGGTLKPQSRALARAGNHKARARGVPPRGVGPFSVGERRPRGLARALPRRHRRRAVLLEEPAEGGAGVRRGADRHLQQRATASAAHPHRDRDGGVGRADEHHRVPPLGVADREHRQPGGTADRPRSVRRHRIRGCRGRRPRDARGARRGRAHRVREDERQPWHPCLLPDRADA